MRVLSLSVLMLLAGISTENASACSRCHGVAVAVVRRPIYAPIARTAVAVGVGIGVGVAAAYGAYYAPYPYYPSYYGAYGVYGPYGGYAGASVYRYPGAASVSVAGVGPYGNTFGGSGTFTPYGGYYNGKYVSFAYSRYPRV